jgi:hypothetical protein
MKTKYLKRIMAVCFAATTLFFSSCLKDDKRFFNAETVPNLAELPLGGLQNFGADAITAAGIDTITFAVGVTAANPPAAPTTITIGVDNTLITKYNSANAAIVYQPIPAAAFKLAATSVIIPAGKNSTLTTVIIDRTQLDPAVSYMLPIKVVSAGGLPISANYGVHYYHIIGNDFAGAYLHTFQRYNAADSTGALSGASFVNQPSTFSPVSPTEFTVATGYAGGVYVFDVTFTKNANGTYSNFKVSFTPGSIADGVGSGIALTQPPVFLVAGGPGVATLPGPYTFAQALKIFHFQFMAMTSGPRYLIDTFHK